MYIVVRRDLTPGQMACQGAHALADFAMRYRDTFEAWNALSNYICILEVENSLELTELAAKLALSGVKVVLFQEPDLPDDPNTAFCAETSARPLLSQLRLAFKSRP